MNPITFNANQSLPDYLTYLQFICANLKQFHNIQEPPKNHPYFAYYSRIFNLSKMLNEINTFQKNNPNSKKIDIDLQYSSTFFAHKFVRFVITIDNIPLRILAHNFEYFQFTAAPSKKVLIFPSSHSAYYPAKFSQIIQALATPSLLSSITLTLLKFNKPKIAFAIFNNFLRIPS